MIKLKFSVHVFMMSCLWVYKRTTVSCWLEIINRDIKLTWKYVIIFGSWLELVCVASDDQYYRFS